MDYHRFQPEVINFGFLKVGDTMFGVERRSKIMSIINEKKRVLVNETAVLFNVTEETIRRDLKVLEGQGLLARTHGGAVLSEDTQIEAPLEIREGINSGGKNLIGIKASEMINDGDTIILLYTLQKTLKIKKDSP